MNTLIVNEEMNMIKGRIEEIRQLQKGWLNGIGNTFNKENLQWAENFIVNIICPFFSKPAIIPCEGETLSLEWITKEDLVSVELILDKHLAIFDALNRKTKKFDYETINLDKKDGIECLIVLLQKVLC